MYIVWKESNEKIEVKCFDTKKEVDRYKKNEGKYEVYKFKLKHHLKNLLQKEKIE